MAQVPPLVAPVRVANLKEAEARVGLAEVLVDSHGVELALKVSQAHPYDGTGGVCGSEGCRSGGAWARGRGVGARRGC